MDLVDREIVRVLDLMFIPKAADGKVSEVDVADVEHSDALDERLWGLSSGLLDQSDIDEVASAIEPGSLAGILVYENVWAVPMWTAIDVLARQAAHAAAHGHAQPVVAQAASPAAIPATSAMASQDMGEKLEQLKQLGDLRAAGVLTDVEFEVQKANILSA